MRSPTDAARRDVTHAEIMDIVRDAERQFPVDTWTIGGLHVWPLVRYPLFFRQYYAAKKSGDAGPVQTASPLRATAAKLKMLGKFAYIATRDWKHNARLDRPVDVLFLTYDVHRVKLDGAWCDRYCEPVVDVLRTLGKTSAICELLATPSFEDIRVPRSWPSAIIEPALELTVIRNKIRRRRPHRDEALTGFVDFLAWAADRGCGFAVPGLDHLRYSADIVLDLSRYGDRLLARARPSLVAEVQHYHEMAWGFTLAARQRGIPTVDIQHGLQGDQHVAYGSWTKVPAGGYELLPDYFWCWSEHEAECIRRWSDALPGKPHQAFVGGDFWWEAWQRTSSALARRHDDRVAQQRAGARALVVVTSSYPGDVADWLLEAMRRTGEDVRWAIRVHPIYWSQIREVRHRLDASGLSSVDVEVASGVPLPALFRHTDVNVTSLSTTVIEAARLGIPSIVTNPTSLDVFANEVAAGLVVPAYTTEEMVAQVEAQLRLGRRAPTCAAGTVSPAARLAEFLALQLPSGHPASSTA